MAAVVAAAFGLGVLLSLSHRKVVQGMTDDELELYWTQMDGRQRTLTQRMVGVHADNRSGDWRRDRSHADARRAYAKWLRAEQDSFYDNRRADQDFAKDLALRHATYHRYVPNYAF